MAIIYCLYWEQDSSIYIGKTINSLKSREYQHLYLLKNNKHYNYKVQDKYLKYGRPKVLLIEESSNESISALETIWIREFNSCIDGLNISYGLEYPIWAKQDIPQEIHKAFKLLCNKNLTPSQVYQLTGVSIPILKSIRYGKAYTSLKDIYPDSYNKLISSKSIRKFIRY